MPVTPKEAQPLYQKTYRHEVGPLFEKTINKFWRTTNNSIVLIMGANWTIVDQTPSYGWEFAYLDGTGQNFGSFLGPLFDHFTEDVSDLVMTSKALSPLAAVQYPGLVVRWFEEHPDHSLSKDLAKLLLLSPNHAVRVKVIALLGEGALATSTVHLGAVNP